MRPSRDETDDDRPIAEGFGNPRAAAIGPFPEHARLREPKRARRSCTSSTANQSATVTVTNLNDPVAPLLLVASRFTGSRRRGDRRSTQGLDARSRSAEGGDT
jgi:hypothetical protein